MYKNYKVFIRNYRVYTSGDESGAQFLNDTIKTLFKNIKDKLPDELRDLINIKIVVADASITSIDVIKKHLEKPNVDTDKFYFKKVSKLPKNIEAETFKFRNKYNGIIINTNSFPSTYIDFKYNIVNETKIINQSLVKGDGYNSLNAIDSEILEKTIKFINDSKNKDKQIIVYIQNIKRLQEINFELMKFYRSKGLDYREEILEINSTLTDTDRQNIFRKKESAKVVLMTSSAARGLTFKKASTLLIDVPDFDLPKNIMEILQLIYRGRGDIFIDTNNHTNIEFFIKNTIYLKEEEDLKVSIKEKLFKVMTLIIILKMSIETRIYGVSRLKKQDFMLVPIGGKAISSVSKLDIDKISDIIRALSKEISKGSQELLSVQNAFKSYFSSVNYGLTEEILKRENIKNSKFDICDIKTEFMKNWDLSFYDLSKMDILKDFYMVGDLIVFKINNKLDTDIQLNIEKVKEIKNLSGNEDRKSLQDFLKQISAIINNTKYHYTFRLQLREVALILESYDTYNKNINSMNLKEETKEKDRFIAIPLLDFIKPNGEYKRINNEEISMRQILELYIKSYYSVSNISPISAIYERESFVTFTSNSFLPMREKIFKSNYVFTSNELNVLNLFLLSK